MTDAWIEPFADQWAETDWPCAVEAPTIEYQSIWLWPMYCQLVGDHDGPHRAVKGGRDIRWGRQFAEGLFEIQVRDGLDGPLMVDIRPGPAWPSCLTGVPGDVWTEARRD